MKLINGLVVVQPSIVVLVSRFTSGSAGTLKNQREKSEGGEGDEDETHQHRHATAIALVVILVEGLASNTGCD